MADIVYLSAAKADLKAIWKHTHKKWGEAQANKYLLAIDAAIETIARNPEIGSPRDYIRTGYRAFLTGRHMIYYTINNDVIRIVRVLHERMDAPHRIDPS